MISNLETLSPRQLQVPLGSSRQADSRLRTQMRPVTWLKKWRHNILTRRQLAQLPDYLLSDIGISDAERVAEITKPFWKN